MRRKGSLLIVILTWLLGVSTAHAAFPGQNGKIAFALGHDLYTVEKDGSGMTRLTTTDTGEQYPSWSPDGSKLVFDTFGQVCIINADGSGRTCPGSASSELDIEPTWSPDGRRIAFVRADLDVDTGAYHFALLTVNADGTGLASVFHAPRGDDPIGSPTWSPDGTRIAFSYQGFIHTIAPDMTGMTVVAEGREADWAPDGSRIAFVRTPDPTLPYQTDIYTVKPDGTGLTRLTNDDDRQGRPAYSPDGREIVFSSVATGQAREIHVMNADGSGRTLLTVPPPSFGSDDTVSWQPILHDIPQSADTLHMSLVPMFRQTISSSQCAARGGQTSTHGAPLAFSSCNPPGYLPNTMARLGPGSSSSVEVTGVPGDPVTSADEADLSFNVAANDVRPRPGGGDYDPSAAPDATLSLLLRWSDTYNGPALRGPATGSDLTYSVPVSCVASADPVLGSNCSTNTTADALAPGAILEGRRTVITLSRWWLYDSGLNATRGDGDDRMFAQSGIYVP